MPTTPLLTFTVGRTPAEIRDNILRTQKVGLQALGIANPNLGPGSEAWIRAESVAGELAVAEANAAIASDDCMPDTAVGEALLRWGRPFIGELRPAEGSAGNVIITNSAASPVIVGAQLTDAASLRYRVTTGGSYADQALIPIEAISTGDDTNLLAGDALTWVSTPPFAQATGLVGTGGLIGGHEQEDDETYRARLFDFWQNAPQSGDSAHLAELAEESSPAVEKAFPYPAAQGPASARLAVVGPITRNAAGQITSMSRVVADATVNNVVGPYVSGNLPEHAAIATTSVVDQVVDVAIGLSLPSAPTASPPGNGSGWLDGTPWPPATSGTTAVSVTAVTSTSVFTVNASTSPIALVSRIAFLSSIDWKIYSATVTAVTVVTPGSSYRITIDTPFVGIAVNDYIWPQCVNQAVYIAALLDAFAHMGPGELTANATILARAYRHPVPALAWPYSLNATQLKAITNTGEEVLDSSWIYRSATTPSVPGAVTLAPSCFMPRHIAFYPTP